tara:strand:+ start:99 stop:710 length:612 start_codon:yes stop_codon:yes gene_type:complete
MNSFQVTGIVLAAGLSSRMGQLKQLLPIGGIPSVVRVVRSLVNAVDEVVVVLGHRAEEIEVVLESERCRCVFNQDYSLGMLSSVQCALSEIQTSSSYLIALADQPQIKESTVSCILQNASMLSKGIVIPKFQGKRGHPVFIHSKYYREISDLNHHVGLNFFTRSHKEDVLEVDLQEVEIVRDMDTPNDYKRIKRLLGDFSRDG